MKVEEALASARRSFKERYERLKAPRELPTIQNDRQHKRWLKLLTTMLKEFPEDRWSPAGSCITALAQRIEAYEKLRWPLDAPKKGKKRVPRS